MQRVAVLGSTGQLGTDLVEILRQDDCFDVIPLSHQDADCTKADEIRSVVVKLRPDVVINCASYVRVDDSEDQPELAFQVNALGAHNVARVCAEINACCVYISTDYVFDGTKEMPYVESDPTNPINVYGTSKLTGEYLVRQTAPRWLIVRVASLFGKTGARGKGGNFIETILAKAKRGEHLRIVDDICISPTYTRDAAEALRALLTKDATGVVHAANDGTCTWHGFAKTALMLCDLPVEVTAVSSTAYPTRARRPKNSALSSERFSAKLNYSARRWQDALQAYLIETGHVAASS